MSNYSFIAIADMHLGCKLYNLPELEQDMKDLFVDICDIAIAKKVDYLLIGGDLFNNNKPTPDLVNFVAEQIKRLKESGVSTLGICGDHDLPVNDTTWMRVSGIQPVLPAENNIPYFVGVDYNIDQQEVMNKVIACASKDVHWIMLHGQVQQLFKFVEEKKKLDFSNIKLFELFPNLKGIVLGDIHNGAEMVITSGSKEAYMGYCGSPGITKSDEINNKKGLLYYDGSKLSRLSLPQKRDFIKISFVGPTPVLNTQFYVLKYKGVKNKPVFIVEYDSDTEYQLTLLKPLYEVGFVKPSQTRKLEEGQVEETINIRSELRTADRIESVLRKNAKSESVFNLGFSLLTSEDNNETYRAILDNFKTKAL